MINPSIFFLSGQTYKISRGSNNYFPIVYVVMVILKSLSKICHQSISV